MNIDQKLLHELESSVASLRNKAALEIVDNSLEEAVPVLAASVARPANVGANGTLVYALGHFDCSRYFELLVDVALHHKFEASREAFFILIEKDFNLNEDQLSAVERALNEAKIDTLLDFQQGALRGIRERFFGRESNEPTAKNQQT